MGHLGKIPPCPGPLSPCGGAILQSLINLLNFISDQDQFKTHENMHISLALKPKQTKVKLSVKLSPSTFMGTKRL